MKVEEILHMLGIEKYVFVKYREVMCAQHAWGGEIRPVRNYLQEYRYDGISVFYSGCSCGTTYVLKRDEGFK